MTWMTPAVMLTWSLGLNWECQRISQDKIQLMERMSHSVPRGVVSVSKEYEERLCLAQLGRSELECVVVMWGWARRGLGGLKSSSSRISPERDTVSQA